MLKGGAVFVLVVVVLVVVLVVLVANTIRKISTAPCSGNFSEIAQFERGYLSVWLEMHVNCLMVVAGGGRNARRVSRFFHVIWCVGGYFQRQRIFG